MSDSKKYGCGCGRSPTGVCVGLHKLTNEEYKLHLQKVQEENKRLDEQIKPQFLVD